MTISRRLGIGYGVIALACLLAMGWLAYHEFVEEPAEFAALGLHDVVHQDTRAEAFTVVVLLVVPALLIYGWWWTRRVLSPLRELAAAAEKIEPYNLRLDLPSGLRGDEIETLSAVLASMTRRLEASLQQMREFTLQASHELKTPLTVMRAQLESLYREQEYLPPERNAWVGRQLDEIARLAQIVDSLSLLTKADAGLMKLERKVVDLRSLVLEAFENAAVLAATRAITVTMDDPAPAKVIGDRHRLRQLLLILVDNAVKYNRLSGSIRLVLSATDGWVELLITNEGGTLGPESRHRVFERFFRGENASQATGSGLGLTIARWIAFAHEGSLRLRPEPPDSTTVCLRLPLVCTPRAAGPGATDVPAKAPGHAPLETTSGTAAGAR